MFGLVAFAVLQKTEHCTERPRRRWLTDFIGSVGLRISSLSGQSFGLQARQISTQRDLLLLVFSQRPVRRTGDVVGIIFALAHDVTLSNCPA